MHPYFFVSCDLSFVFIFSFEVDFTFQANLPSLLYLRREKKTPRTLAKSGTIITILDECTQTSSRKSSGFDYQEYGANDSEDSDSWMGRRMGVRLIQIMQYQGGMVLFIFY